MIEPSSCAVIERKAIPPVDADASSRGGNVNVDESDNISSNSSDSNEKREYEKDVAKEETQEVQGELGEPAIGVPEMPPTKRAKVVLHCVRCHEDYDPTSTTNDDDDDDDESNQCIIEHDDDTFEGYLCDDGRWVKGRVRCCGASYMYHRFHYCTEVRANRTYCFRGRHTTDPNQVQYNGKSICICHPNNCGFHTYEQTRKVAAQQKKALKRQQKQQQLQQRQQKQQQQQQHADEKWILSLPPSQRRRMERRARATRLGLLQSLDDNVDEYNSDVNPENCTEFDAADDSSVECSVVTSTFQDDDECDNE